MLSLSDYIVEILGVELYNFLSVMDYAVILRDKGKVIIRVNPIRFFENHMYIDETSAKLDKILANVYYNRRNPEETRYIFFSKILPGMGMRAIYDTNKPRPIPGGMLYKNDSFAFMPFLIEGDKYYVLVESSYMNRPHIFALKDTNVANFYNDAKIIVASCGCEFLMIGISTSGILAFNENVKEVVKYTWDFTQNPPVCHSCGREIKFESPLNIPGLIL